MTHNISKQLCEELKRDLFYGKTKSSLIISLALPSIINDKQFEDFCKNFIAKFTYLDEQQVKHAQETIAKLCQLRELCDDKITEQNVAKFIDRMLILEKPSNHRSLL